MNLRHLTLHQLRIFQAVAAHNSFARAAEALHLSPPTLSLQVKQLANTVGQPLFEQLGKKIFLTSAGQTLADAAMDISKRVDLLAEDLSALQGVDVGASVGKGLTIKPIDSMINHHSCELFFDDLRIPAANLLGKEGEGFKVILDGMNAERILIAAECVGDGRYFVDKASKYATEREVFGRPIGMNQGVQFPIARCYADIEAAWLMVEKAAKMFDAGLPCGAEANMAKMLASEASWRAGDVCMQTHGGFAFAKEYHIERKFRETRLYQIAPISTNLILSFVAEHVLKMPRSF